MPQTIQNTNEAGSEKNPASATNTKSDSNKQRAPTRFAKKSTTSTPPALAPELTTRHGQPKRLAALATKDKLMENFNPDTSNREKRKLERKLKSNVKPKTQSVNSYDANGCHVASGISLCDCLDTACPGCFFPCKKCSSLKCGPDCRNNRKIIYESVEYHGFSYIKKNPLDK